VADRYVLVPMTLSDPNPGFKVTVHLQVEYLKISECLRDKLTIGKPYAIYRMVPLSITLIDLNQDFKVAIFYDIEYPRNDMR